MTFLSPAALSRAFTRVRENHGCAGCDGVTIAEFQQNLAANLGRLRQAVEDESYFAWPVRRIEVEKRPGSPDRRTLLVPTVADRVLQTAVAAFLEPILEPEFEECSFAYRRGRSVRMAVERVHALFLQGYRWVLDADIDAFFDSVDKEVALSALAPLVHDETVLRLGRLWLDYAVWDGLHLTRPPLGLPQGLVLSPMFANLCLDSFDERLLRAGLKLVRYSDDFVVLSKSRKAAQDALELTEEALAQLHLKLKEGKTRLVRASDGFRFLGVIFLKDLLVQPLRGGRKRLKALSVAPLLPEHFFPASERRPLRRYRSC